MKLVIGKNYLVETPTKYWLGRLVSVDGPRQVTLVDASWIADTGRYHEFVRDGRADGMEVEPLPDGQEIEVERYAITAWPHPLLREVA